MRACVVLFRLTLFQHPERFEVTPGRLRLPTAEGAAVFFADTVDDNAAAPTGVSMDTGQSHHHRRHHHHSCESQRSPPMASSVCRHAYEERGSCEHAFLHTAHTHGRSCSDQSGNKAMTFRHTHATIHTHIWPLCVLAVAWPGDVSELEPPFMALITLYKGPSVRSPEEETTQRPS